MVCYLLEALFHFGKFNPLSRNRRINLIQIPATPEHKVADVDEIRFGVRPGRIDLAPPAVVQRLEFVRVLR